MVDIHDQESLNQMYDEFCETLKTELVYRRVSSGDCYHKPWWTDCLATLRKNVRTALKRWEMNNQNPSLKDLFLKALTMKYVEQRELITDTYMMNFYPIIEQGQNTFGDKDGK